MAFGDADASTPAVVSVNSNWTTTGGTSASFTPPAGSLVRLAVFSDTSSGANPGAETVTDSLNGATGWLNPIRRSKPDSGSQAAAVSQWERYFAAAPGSPITITVVGGVTGAGAGGFSTKVVAGCTGTAGHVEGSNTAAVVSIVETTVNADCRVEVAATDWNVMANMTAGTGQTAVLASSVGSGPDTRIYVGIQNAVTATPSTAVTMSTASPSSGNANNFIAWELVPSSGTGATATPAAAAAVAAVPAPTVSAGSTAAPAATACVAALPPAAVAASSTKAPAAIATTAALPAATISAGSTATPAAIAAAVAVPAAAVSSGSTTAPATVSAVVALPQASISASATVTPGVVAATVTLPAPTIDTAGNATVTPTPIAAVVQIHSVTVSAGSRVTPATVAATVSVLQVLFEADAAKATSVASVSADYSSTAAVTARRVSTSTVTARATSSGGVT